MDFEKMHGLGNDYIVINNIDGVLDKYAKKHIMTNKAMISDLCNRHTGIGADGILLIQKSLIADYKMCMFNPDGSEGMMCGNGIRCVGKYIYDHEMKKDNKLSIETRSGVKKLEIKIKNDKAYTIRVSMGKPIFCEESKTVLVNSKEHIINKVLIGNPHVVILTHGQNFEKLNIDKVGRGFQKLIDYKNGINVEFANIDSDTSVAMRVYERGTGETTSCGTGTCAVVAIGVKKGLLLKNKTIKVSQLGGVLEVIYDNENNIFLEGLAEYVYRGVI